MSAPEDTPASAPGTPDWKKFEQLAGELQKELTPDAKVTVNAKVTGKKSKTARQIDILIEQIVAQFTLRSRLGVLHALHLF